MIFLIFLALPLVYALDSESFSPPLGDSESMVGFFGDLENFPIGKVPEAPPGGGGGGAYKLTDINETACNITYKYLENGTDYSLITIIQEELKNLTNRTFGYTEIKAYLTDWQRVCSNLINRSLNESYLCERIYEFVIEKNKTINQTDIISLSKIINYDLFVTEKLLNYYIENYETMCFQKEITPTLIDMIIEKKKFNYWWLVLILGILMACFLILKKKKVLLILMGRKSNR